MIVKPHATRPDRVYVRFIEVGVRKVHFGIKMQKLTHLKTDNTECCALNGFLQGYVTYTVVRGGEDVMSNDTTHL